MIYYLFGFAEVRILPSFLVMTSFLIISKLTYSVEFNIGYQPSKFQSSMGLDQILQENTPPPGIIGIKKPNAFSVNIWLTFLFRGDKISQKFKYFIFKCEQSDSVGKCPMRKTSLAAGHRCEWKSGLKH